MDTNNKNNQFNNPVVIILLLALVGMGGYFIFSKNSSNNEQGPVAQDTPSVSQVSPQPNSQQSEIDTLRKEVDSLKNQKPQTIIEEVPAKSGTDLSSIISYWRSRVSYVECDLEKYDANGGFITDSGSGSVFIADDGTVRVVTNKHVLIIDDAIKAIASICRIKFPDNGNTFTASRANREIWWASDENGGDWGYLTITPDVSLKNILATPLKDCPTKPLIGDSVLILGYPGIGSKTDITATEGIISGYDGDYYITSAKVEHGNSGGAAILVKSNCMLGIPTFAETGSVESLARILDLHVAVR